MYIYIYLKRAHRRSVCARKAELTRKSARLFSTRAKCFWRKREQSILYLIWHLFNRRGEREAKESRHLTFKKESHNELSLNGKRGSHATTFRATGNTIPYHRSCAFLLRSSQSERRRCERDKGGGQDEWVVSSNLPIQMSFQKSQIEKKIKERILSADDVYTRGHFLLSLSHSFAHSSSLYYCSCCCY